MARENCRPTREAWIRRNLAAVPKQVTAARVAHELALLVKEDRAAGLRLVRELITACGLTLRT